MEFKIFKTSYNKHEPGDWRNDKYTGAYLTDNVYARLILTSIAKGEAKSSLLRVFVEKNVPPLDKLINQVADILVSVYKEEKEPWSNFSVKVYKNYAREELERRKVSGHLITQILTLFDNKMKDGKKTK